jgi:dTDP-4-amino-4,6-dideoxygalactose transaminase
MAINIFVPKFHTDEILAEIKECLDKGWTGLGFKTVEFENKWKEYTGLPYAHFLNSNTSGLHLAVHILKKVNGWKDDDEIITTPLTFVSTNHVILYERLRPVFADVDEYLCLDPVSVKKRITKKTRAVIYVGIGGNTGQYQEIINICKEHNLKLILDAAHMSGTKFKGKHVGPESNVAVFSFQAVKNLPTADSGMICFQDEELDMLARQLSWLGISKDTFQRYNSKEGSYKWYYDVPNIGFKYHGNSIIAAIGLIQLKYLEQDNKQRNALANYYIENLKDLLDFKIVPIAENCYSSRHLFQVSTENRNEKIEQLYTYGIFPGVHYVDNTNYTMYSYANGTCPKARYYSDHIISLPLHLNIIEKDIDTVIAILRANKA